MTETAGAFIVTEIEPRSLGFFLYLEPLEVGKALPSFRASILHQYLSSPCGNHRRSDRIFTFAWLGHATQHETDSFAQAVRRSLREYPDMILIGEIRDKPTADAALLAQKPAPCACYHTWRQRSWGPRTATWHLLWRRICCFQDIASLLGRNAHGQKRRKAHCKGNADG